MGAVPDDRLGVERDPEAGRVEHVEVVGAVADRDRAVDRTLACRANRRSALALPARSTISADQLAGELAVDDLEALAAA